MVDMLSRARFGDEVAESEEEEVPEDYFAFVRVHWVYVIREFWEKEYEGETLQIGNNDGEQTNFAYIVVARGT